MRKPFAVVGMLLSLLVGTADAFACGGCFGPPPPRPEAVQTVTAHRMVLSLSRTQTTLWDQFSYAGAPNEFSWILPIQNGPQTRVALADDRFMNMIDNATAPIITPPQRAASNCNFNCAFAGNASADAGASADASGPPSVNVYQQSVVGPYQVAVIGGTNAMAIRDWLRENGYTVPPSLNPIIDHYTAMRSDYVALRLRPGEGTNRMNPVRVTTPGYQPVLPLRMIAAGIADKVGLQLFTFADSRIEARNFANGELSNDDFTYDFNNPTSPTQDYLSAFNRLNQASNGRLWLAETVETASLDSYLAQASNYLRNNPTNEELCANPSAIPPWQRDRICPDAGVGEAGVEEDAAADAQTPVADAAVTPGDGGTSMMMERADILTDVRVAFEGLGPQPRVTRLRADLSVGRLDQDLLLQASAGALRNRYYYYGRVLNNTPLPCPPNPCGPSTPSGTGRPPGRNVAAGGGCNAAPMNEQSSGLGFALGILGVAFLAQRNRRRSH